MYLYATDYDGTVTYHGVTPELKEALARWKAAGHLFGVVSGRPYESIRHAVTKDGLPVDFVIANNGAVIADGNDRILEIIPLPDETSQKLIAYIAREPHGMFRMDAARRLRGWKCIPEAVMHNGMLRVDGEVWRDITEITADYPGISASLEAAKEIETLFPGVSALIPSPHNIDYVSDRVSKAAAIRRVAQLMQLHPEKIFTTGDSHNDLAMLRCPDFEGYAVENAMESVKEAVGRVVADPLELLLRLLGEA